MLPVDEIYAYHVYVRTLAEDKLHLPSFPTFCLLCTTALKYRKPDAMNYYWEARDLVTNPKHTQWLSPLLLVVECAICAVIILKIPCKFTHATSAGIFSP